jgi:hypothetical protein
LQNSVTPRLQQLSRVLLGQIGDMLRASLPHCYISFTHLMSDHITARDALTSRIIPQMVLSTNENPLTAPITSNRLEDPKQRAGQRFAVHGNAIS